MSKKITIKDGVEVLGTPGWCDLCGYTFGGINCLQKPYNIHRNRLKTLAFYY